MTLARLLLLAGWWLAAACAHRPSQHAMCEPVSVPLCADMPYNATIMPNLLGHLSQEEAGKQAHLFFPLVKAACSADLQAFLCSVYAPPCTALPRPVPPCRDSCLRASRGCEDIIDKFAWPEGLDCDRFPAASHDVLCVGDGASLEALTTQPPLKEVTGMDFQCPVYFQTPGHLDYQLRVGEALVEDCGAPCDGMFYSAEESRLSRTVLGAIAALVLAIALFCWATFLLDRGRFPYPERPIIYMSVCYALISLCYVAGWWQGTALACDPPHEPPQHLEAEADLMIRAITQRDHNTPCTLLFMLQYLFTLAACAWWLVLTLAWFLMAGLKWSHEAVEQQAALFHAAAWAGPALATVGAVSSRRVQGDVLTGTCFVGLWDSSALLWFVLVPLLASLVLGILLLLAGFCSVVRMRAALAHAQSGRMRSFVARIAVFSLLYCVPAGLVVALVAYQQLHHDSWMLAWQRDKCLLREEPWLKYGISCPPGDQHSSRPPLAFFLVRHLSSLLIGLLAGLWVWSGKTLALWRDFILSIVSCKTTDHV